MVVGIGCAAELERAIRCWSAHVRSNPSSTTTEVVVEYDEDTELTHYVWEYCTSFMTEFERRVGKAIIYRMKAKTSDHPMITRKLDEWGHVGDLHIDAALADGPEVFRRRVCERVLTEYGSKVFIHRCPKCNRVLRTSKAQQCFWCGADWHS
jgi:hypothetical protein